MAYSTIKISDLGGSIAANVLLCVFIAAPVPLCVYFGLSYAVIRKSYFFYFGTTPMVFYCTIVCLAIPLICYTNTHNLRNYWILNDGTTYNGDISDIMANPDGFTKYQFFNITGVYIYKGSLIDTELGVQVYNCPSRYGTGGFRVFCSMILVPANFSAATSPQTPIFAACQTTCSILNTPATTCDSLGAFDTVGDGSCFAYWSSFSDTGQGNTNFFLSKKLPSNQPLCAYAAARAVTNDIGDPLILTTGKVLAYATEIVDDTKLQTLKELNYNFVINTNAIIFSITYFVWLIYGIGKIILYVYWDD